MCLLVKWAQNAGESWRQIQRASLGIKSGSRKRQCLSTSSAPSPRQGSGTGGPSPVMLAPMQCSGHSSTKNLLLFILEFKFCWTSCVLSTSHSEKNTSQRDLGVRVVTECAFYHPVMRGLRNWLKDGPNSPRKRFLGLQEVKSRQHLCPSSSLWEARPLQSQSSWTP